mmetsp:Transcript_83922/g.232568  ORF Transcript_83922/g.232568 Transcript_83922/m.232568 type:complete len:106 (-) Transcript_83922:58-375(-)
MGSAGKCLSESSPQASSLKCSECKCSTCASGTSVEAPEIERMKLKGITSGSTGLHKAGLAGLHKVGLDGGDAVPMAARALGVDASAGGDPAGAPAATMNGTILDS